MNRPNPRFLAKVLLTSQVWNARATSDWTIAVGNPLGCLTTTFRSCAFCWKSSLTPDLCHILLSAWVLDNLAMFNRFRQKRERIKKKVIFDPVKALGAANLLVFLHRLLLDKYIFTELKKQHTKILNVVWKVNLIERKQGQSISRNWENSFVTQDKLQDVSGHFAIANYFQFSTSNS